MHDHFKYQLSVCEYSSTLDRIFMDLNIKLETLSVNLSFFVRVIFGFVCVFRRIIAFSFLLPNVKYNQPETKISKHYISLSEFVKYKRPLSSPHPHSLSLSLSDQEPPLQRTTKNLSPSLSLSSGTTPSKNYKENEWRSLGD